MVVLTRNLLFMNCFICLFIIFYNNFFIFYYPVKYKFILLSDYFFGGIVSLASFNIYILKFILFMCILYVFMSSFYLIFSFLIIELFLHIIILYYLHFISFFTFFHFYKFFSYFFINYFFYFIFHICNISSIFSFFYFSNFFSTNKVYNKINNIFFEVLIIFSITIIILILLLPSVSFLYFNNFFINNSYLYEFFFKVIGNQWFWCYSGYINLYFYDYYNLYLFDNYIISEVFSISDSQEDFLSPNSSFWRRFYNNYTFSNTDIERILYWSSIISSSDYSNSSFFTSIFVIRFFYIHFIRCFLYRFFTKFYIKFYFSFENNFSNKLFNDKIYFLSFSYYLLFCFFRYSNVTTLFTILYKCPPIYIFLSFISPDFNSFCGYFPYTIFFQYFNIPEISSLNNFSGVLTHPQLKILMFFFTNLNYVLDFNTSIKTLNSYFNIDFLHLLKLYLASI